MKFAPFKLPCVYRQEFLKIPGRTPGDFKNKKRVGNFIILLTINDSSSDRAPPRRDQCLENVRETFLTRRASERP
jgi:hypothetical protein